MMLIQRIIDALLVKGIQTIYYTSQTAFDLLGLNIGNKVTCFFIPDARSAVFTAYGVAKMSLSPTIVLIDESYLPNTYTALTEAWFQRVPVIIISYNSKNTDSSAYLDRCVDTTCFVNKETDLSGTIDLICSMHGPSLIKVQEEIKENLEIDYTSILNLLEHHVSNLPDIFFYDCKVENEGYRCIETRHKYGVLSKYVGYLSCGKDAILCIPEDLLALESNIFCIRDFPKKFKLIVKKRDSLLWNKLKAWMSRNGVHVYDKPKTNIEESLMELLKDTPVAIFID